jgi:molybdate transport system substrate-binding protein
VELSSKVMLSSNLMNLILKIYHKKFILILNLALIYFNLSCKPENQAQRDNELRIAAASDLHFALDSVLTVFKQENPELVVHVNYGSSGKFYHQIVNDAPFDMYFSADINYPQKLEEQGFTTGGIHLYAVGRIVIWSRKISTIKGTPMLLSEEIYKIAIANPAHAPYGQRSVEALQYYGIYETLRSKLVMGENIAQAAQFVISGAAEAGILALSLAISPTLKDEGEYYLIPEEAHTPLEQAFVVLKKAGNKKSVVLFSDFISSETARAILKQYGFSVPQTNI